MHDGTHNNTKPLERGEAIRRNQNDGYGSHRIVADSFPYTHIRFLEKRVVATHLLTILRSH